MIFESILTVAHSISEDKSLFELVRKGDQRSFEVLFNKYYQPLCRFAFQLLEEELASEEIVQDVFCALWEDREHTELTSFKSYCYQVVRNKCLNALKHIKVREAYKIENEYQINLEQHETEETEQKEELNHRIHESIELMPEMRKRVFKMSRFEGLKYKEIASQLNISVKTVENHMGKALAHLRTDLAKYVVMIIAFVHFYLKNK